MMAKAGSEQLSIIQAEYRRFLPLKLSVMSTYMLIPYNARKLEEKVDVKPIINDDENFAIVPAVSVVDGAKIPGQITLIHKKTGFAIFNASSDDLLYLASVCSHLQAAYPLLGACPNHQSVKKYAKRTHEGRSFKDYAMRVDARLGNR